jgi:TNF receptor-associated protein 1
VTSVASGKRLVDNPVIALVPADGMSPQMRQMMKAMDENFKDEVKVELEINPRHPLVRKLAEAKDSQSGTGETRFPPTPRQRPHRRRPAWRTPATPSARMNTLMEKAMG